MQDVVIHLLIKSPFHSLAITTHTPPLRSLHGVEWSQINNGISLAFIILPKLHFYLMAYYGIMNEPRTERDENQNKNEKTERTTQQSRGEENRKT